MKIIETKNMMYWMCCLMPDSRACSMMGDAQQPLRAS